MSFSKSKVAIVIVLLVAVGGGFAWYSHANKPENQKQAGVISRKSTKQKNVTVTTANDDNSKTQKKTHNGESDIKLIAPSGGFVSNHRPNLDSNPAPNSMNSTCRTNAGVACEIRFTKGGVTKTLGPNTTGSDGFISWDWKLQDIGLTVGSWQITAIASHNDNTESVADPIMLEVGQ